MLGIGIFGATGKVGSLLIGEILACKDTVLSSVYVRNELQYNIPSSVLITKDMDSFIESNQIIIDFSSPEATQNLLEHALKNPIPLVIGTTGLNAEQMDFLRQCSQTIPILYSANMSEGIAILDKIAGILSIALRHYDIEITEIHHKYKKDSPSGTALMLANTVTTKRNLDTNVLKFGRKGIDLRQNDEIGIVSLRGGDIVGRHTIGFYTDGEHLELTHNATSRKTFAKGALRAALWLAKKPNGLYNMQDIFDFNVI